MTNVEWYMRSMCPTRVAHNLILYNILCIVNSCIIRYEKRVRLELDKTVFDVNYYIIT